MNTKRYARKIETAMILFASILYLFIFGCGNPVSEEEKKATVKTILEGTLLSGTHIRFWNGTDENDKLVSAGTYYIMLYTQEFTYPQYRITALSGGTGKSNESPVKYIADFPPTTGIESADPDTFYIEDGTNIRFTLSEEMGIRLTIRNKE